MSGSTGSSNTISSSSAPSTNNNAAQQIDLSSLVATLGALVQQISANTQTIIQALEGVFTNAE